MALIAQDIPKIGLVMDAVKVVRWLKNVGDTVRLGEPLVEVETEKSIVEIEATTGGRLAQILVQVDQQAEQLHIHDSPICSESGQSGCVFFSGFLEGLLGPAMQSNQISIFSVCCRSFGAGECILAVSD